MNGEPWHAWHDLVDHRMKPAGKVLLLLHVDSDDAPSGTAFESSVTVAGPAVAPTQPDSPDAVLAVSPPTAASGRNLDSEARVQRVSFHMKGRSVPGPGGTTHSTSQRDGTSSSASSSRNRRRDSTDATTSRAAVPIGQSSETSSESPSFVVSNPLNSRRRQ